MSTGETAKSSVSQKAVETKQLSPRLAGEWFGIPNATDCRRVAKEYAKFGAGRPAVGAVLGEGVQKILYGVVSCFLSRLWGFNMHTYNCSHWIPVEFILYTFRPICLTASSKPSMSGRKRF